METTTNNILNELSEIKQIKLIPPGCQTNYKYIISSNDLFFCYASNMTINVFNIKDFQIKCILNPGLEIFAKSLCMNQGKRKELAVYYFNEILIFDLDEEKIKIKIKIETVLDMEFNIEDQLLIIQKNGGLCYYHMVKKKVENIKAERVSIAKWNPFTANELIYAFDNTICYYNINSKNKISELEMNEDKNFTITEMSWYNLDENYKYVLVGMNDGQSFLVDVSQSFIIMKFEKYSNNILNMIWLRYEPGTFLSLSKNSGRAVFWNVSKKNYNEISKFSDSPIMYGQAMSDANFILMSLDNGSIMIYDVKNRKTAFKIEPNHSETIFDLKYNPITYGIFATCSFDSTIKIWNSKDNKIVWSINLQNIKSSTTKKASNNLENIDSQADKIHIYTLVWSPVDCNLLASGDSKKSIRIFDISKQKYITGYSIDDNEKETPVVGIDWNINNEIIFSHVNTMVLLKYENGKLILTKSFKGESIKNQIKFNPFDLSIYAAACYDKCIRIYNKDKEIKLLKGHTSKVFGVSWNPKRKGILSSTSDDFKIGIWNLNTDVNFFLSGHSNKTRHCVWITECSNILITSSWDGVIKIWDVDLKACIGEIIEHYSDVYGIDINPHHPFLLTSCSRDNSIRFFNISINLKLMTDYILNFDNIKFMNTIDFPNLEEKFKLTQEIDSISLADTITNYFYYYDALKDFWDIIKVVTGKKQYCNPENRIFYVADLYSAYKSRVQQLEFAYFSKAKFDYSVKKEDLLKEAIELSSKSGDWEKFCELCVEANEWEEAIMAAPNVSIAYWKELCKKYADYSTNKNLPTKKFASLLSNELQPALKNCIESRDYEDAKLIWLTRGNKSSEKMKNNSSFIVQSNFEEDLDVINKRLDNLQEEDELIKTSEIMGRQYITNGLPILAACSYISIKDKFNTLKCLVRTAEFEIAYITMKALNERTFESDIMMALCLKELNRGGIGRSKSVLKIIQTIDIAVTIGLFIKNLKKLKNNIFEEFEFKQEEVLNYLKNSENYFLYSICIDDLKASISIFYTTTDELAKYINNKIGKFDFSKVSRYMFYIKAIDLSSIEFKFYLRILITAACLEAFNCNVKSCAYYLSEIGRLINKKNYELDETENILLSFAATFIKLEKYKHEDANIEYIKIISDLAKFKEYSIISKKYKKTENKEGKIYKLMIVFKYNCDDIGYFFCIRDEIFPVNISKVINSNLNGKKIRGKPVKVKENFLLSTSQSLEWFKFDPYCPILTELELFNPY